MLVAPASVQSPAPLIHVAVLLVRRSSFLFCAGNKLPCSGVNGSISRPSPRSGGRLLRSGEEPQAVEFEERLFG
jgi:hypothetical protein